jgi:hypothetical protein
MRRFSDPVVWTHLFLVAGVYLWALAHMPAAILLACATLCSTMYHIGRESDEAWHNFDRAFAVVTLGATLSISLPVATFDQGIMLGIIAIVAFAAKEIGTRWNGGEADYVIFHSMWHVLVAVGQCMLAVIYANSQGVIS